MNVFTFVANEATRLAVLCALIAVGLFARAEVDHESTHARPSAPAGAPDTTSDKRQ
jgi:hypothetical protein